MNINGHQATIVWHVDDLKISHRDPAIVTRIIKKLQRAYGKVNPLTINRGKVHDYLGMTLDYGVKGKVIITMYDYIIKMLAEIPEEWGGTNCDPSD